MVVHSHDDLFLSRVFWCSLKGAAYNWFYSPKHLWLVLLPLMPLLWSFKEVKHAFYYQYAFQQGPKKNNSHLLTIKMKPGASLKYFVSYFQSQMALVYNFNDDMATLCSSVSCKSLIPFTNT